MSPSGGQPTSVTSEPTRAQMLRRVLVLGTLTALGPLTIDLYLPAFPAIADGLDAADSAVQLTLTGTLFGFAIGQLILGPLSDALGRRRPLIAATLVHVAASVLCALAPNIAVLGGFRVLQGMAAAAGAVVSMAVVRDLYTGLPAIRLLSRLMLVTGVAPVLAPSLGGQVLRFTDWRGVFWVLAILSLALAVVVVIGLRETLPEERRRSGGVVGTIRTYGTILRGRTFVGLMLTGGLTMAALFAYISGSSFVFQDVYGLSEQTYGIVFGVNSVGLVIATQLNARLVRYVKPQWVLAGALVVASTVSVAMVVFALTGLFGIYGIAVPLFVLLSMVGFTMPNTPALALAEHGASAGTAAALLGAMNFAIGGFTAPLVGALGSDTALPMAGTMAVMALLALGAMFLIARPGQLTDPHSTPSPDVPAETATAESAEPATELTARSTTSPRGRRRAGPSSGDPACPQRSVTTDRSREHDARRARRP